MTLTGRRQAWVINPGQAIRVRLAIEWGVHPDNISVTRLNSVWRDRASSDPVWIEEQKQLHFSEQVVLWQR